MKNKNFIQSFNNALSGIIYTVKNERNMKFHIASMLAVIALSLYYDLTKVELLIVCLTIGLVVICELFNTAIEIVIDIIVDVFHPKAKIIKDAAAGAVLVSAFISVIVGYVIFFDRITATMQLIFRG